MEFIEEIRRKISNFIEKIKSLKSHPSDYPELLWIIFVFVGACFNAVIIKNFAVWLSFAIQFPSLDYAIAIILYSTFVFFTPLIMSWIFSRNHPEKRLVPPLYIQGISFGLLAFFVYNILPLQLAELYLLGIYTLGSGMLQNLIMIYALGKTVIPDNIFRHSLSVPENIEKVKEIVLSKKFRDLFLFKRKVQTEETTLKLRTSSSKDWQYILEVKKSEKKNETILNFCLYVEGSYKLETIKETDNSYDYALDKISNIKNYFLRHHELKVESISDENAEPLVTFVLDDFLGKLAKIQEMTTRKKISIFIVVTSIIAGIGLIISGNLAIGIATFGIAIPLIVDVLLRS